MKQKEIVGTQGKDTLFVLKNNRLKNFFVQSL
jgi:hypothetical protein